MYTLLTGHSSLASSVIMMLICLVAALGCDDTQQKPAKKMGKANHIDVESLTAEDAKRLAIEFAEGQAVLDDIDSASEQYDITVNRMDDRGWRIFFDKKNSKVEGEHFTIVIEPERGMLFFAGY